VTVRQIEEGWLGGWGTRVWAGRALAHPSCEQGLHYHSPSSNRMVLLAVESPVGGVRWVLQPAGGSVIGQPEWREGERAGPPGRRAAAGGLAADGGTEGTAGLIPLPRWPSPITSARKRLYRSFCWRQTRPLPSKVRGPLLPTTLAPGLLWVPA